VKPKYTKIIKSTFSLIKETNNSNNLKNYDLEEKKTTFWKISFVLQWHPSFDAGTHKSRKSLLQYYDPKKQSSKKAKKKKEKKFQWFLFLH
jgi:hypothetical protein